MAIDDVQKGALLRSHVMEYHPIVQARHRYLTGRFTRDVRLFLAPHGHQIIAHGKA